MGRKVSRAQTHLRNCLQGPLRAETARAILRSAEPDAHGRVGFAAFCSAMLPADVDTSIAVKVADYVAMSFV